MATAAVLYIIPLALAFSTAEQKIIMKDFQTYRQCRTVERAMEVDLHANGIGHLFQIRCVNLKSKAIPKGQAKKGFVEPTQPGSSFGSLHAN